jgi:hypothetical protein
MWGARVDLSGLEEWQEAVSYEHSNADVSCTEEHVLMCKAFVYLWKTTWSLGYLYDVT